MWGKEGEMRRSTEEVRQMGECGMGLNEGVAELGREKRGWMSEKESEGRMDE